MDENKQEMIDEILDEKRPVWVMVVKAIVICLVVVLIVIGGFIGGLQLKTFERMQQRQTLGEFKDGLVSALDYDEQGFEVAVTDEILAQVMAVHVAEQLVPQASLKNIYYDSQDQHVEMNLSYFGFYLPISFQTTFEQLNNSIVIHYEQMTFGNNYESLGERLTTSVRNKIGLISMDQVIDLERIGISNHLTLTDLQIEATDFTLYFQVDEARIEDEVNQLRQTKDPLLFHHYKAFGDQRTKQVLEIIASIYPLSHDQIEVLVNDALSSQFIISDLLLITKGYETDGLEQLMEDYTLSIDLNKIDLERKAFSGQAIDGDIAQIFVALDTHFGDKIMALNQGKPFDIEEMTTYTIVSLAQAYDVAIEEEILNQLTFVYDEVFHVAYQIDEDAYYVRRLDDYEVINAESYNEMQGASGFITPTYVEDKALWVNVVAFIKSYLETEELFVRYMKSDGTSIFTVVSSIEDPQAYYAMAIQQRGDGFELLEEKVTSIASLLSEHPEFNAETATKDIETAAFERIGDDILDLIIDELYDQRKIPSKSEASIVYSSYDGSKYITFKLSNGDEYVYKVENTVYGTYLSTVYTKAKALRNWKDLPELLVLQDPPE